MKLIVLMGLLASLSVVTGIKPRSGPKVSLKDRIHVLATEEAKENLIQSSSASNNIDTQNKDCGNGVAFDEF